jgi:hypothetical protein
MDCNRIPNRLLHYRPHGKRSLGRPLKRWNETITGHLAYYLMNMMMMMMATMMTMTMVIFEVI